MKLKVIDDLPFDDKNKVLDLIAGVDELSLKDKENIFSIRGNYFKGNTDKNIIDIYKEELEIFFVERSGNSFKLEDSPVFKFYKSLNFHLIDLTVLQSLFKTINQLSHQYHFYKPYDYSPHFRMFDTIFHYRNQYIPKTITLKLHYDVAGALSAGKGSPNFGSTTIDKLYKINPDCSVSELIDIHFPLKLTDKMSIRLINVDGIHKVYYSFKQDDPFVHIEMTDLEDLVKQKFLERYQSAVKKHLNIKDAEYNPDYISVLQMIKI
jgi:hypothetical protein